MSMVISKPPHKKRQIIDFNSDTTEIDTARHAGRPESTAHAAGASAVAPEQYGPAPWLFRV